jgi:hypothetical protein
MAANRSELDRPNDARGRSKYRDGDDVRDPTPPKQRSDTKPDTKSEARGPARESIGRTARRTDDAPTGPEGRDRMRNRDDA